MPATVIDGRAIRDALMAGLTNRIAALSFKPTLAIIQVGSRSDSNAFIRAKKKFAEKIGTHVRHLELVEKIHQNEVVDMIKGLNADPTVHGVIVQLPLPLSIDKDTVIDAIHPRKDVDALTSCNVKRWLEGKDPIPATARGIRTMLDYDRIDLSGKRVVVVGRSMLVGKPIATMCLNENATVTVCHSKTSALKEQTISADILIVAAGKPNLIGSEHVREGQVVIDVGINTLEDGKMTGDVKFDEVSRIVSFISPVPGGVGPMTVFSLFENLIDMCDNQNIIN